MKQTAVEFLLKQITLFDETLFNENGGLYFTPYMKKEIIEQAKAMEKEQIKDAYEDGLYDGDGRNRSNYNMNAEQYYNETFKSE